MLKRAKSHVSSEEVFQMESVHQNACKEYVPSCKHKWMSNFAVNGAPTAFLVVFHSPARFSCDLLQHMRAHPVSSFNVCLILKTDAASSAANGGRKRTRMPDSVGHAHLTRAILVASRKGG